MAWLACSIQSVMSAPINVGHSVHAFVGLRLLCVSPWFFPRRKPGSALGVAPIPNRIKLGEAASGKISVPLGSIMTFVC